MSYIDQRCDCGSLLCCQTEAGNFEFRIGSRNIFIAFPWGMVQCRKCEKIWIVKPFKKLEQIENKLVNLKVDYFKQEINIRDSRSPVR